MNPWELNEREINAPPSNRELYISYDEKDMVAKRAQKKLVEWIDGNMAYNENLTVYTITLEGWQTLKKKMGIE